MADYKKTYERWLESDAINDETRAELESLKGNDKEIEERFYRELEFGTAGMRGILGAGTNRMNIYNVRRATTGVAKHILALGDEAKKAGVLILPRQFLMRIQILPWYPIRFRRLMVTVYGSFYMHFWIVN